MRTRLHRWWVNLLARAPHRHDTSATIQFLREQRAASYAETRRLRHGTGNPVADMLTGNWPERERE
jgi:hypothetical protein